MFVVLGVGAAPRKVVCGPRSYCGGRCFASTPLRCSPGGGAAELATCPCGALRSNSRGEPEVEARVSFGTRARPQAALLAAPEIARTADHLPRRGTRCAALGDGTSPTSSIVALHPAPRSPRPFPAKAPAGPARRASGAPRSAGLPAARVPKDTRASTSDSSQLFERSAPQGHAASSAMGRLPEHRREAPAGGRST